VINAKAVPKANLAMGASSNLPSAFGSADNTTRDVNGDFQYDDARAAGQIRRI
jgi:hypothetical protein